MTLNGGAHGLFKSNCATPSGTATASLTDQNGNKTASAPATFTVAACTASGSAVGTGSGSGSGGGSRTSGASGTPTPRLIKTAVTGLRSGRVALGFTLSEGSRRAKMNCAHRRASIRSELRPPPRRQAAQGHGYRPEGRQGQVPGALPQSPGDHPYARGQATLGFRVSAASGAPKLSTLTVRAVPGLTFVRQRVHKRLRVVGVTLKGAKLKSVSLGHGGLLIKLVKPANAVTVMVGHKGLRESRALRTKAQHSKVKRSR